ncbi:MAG: hypothetical protein LBE17_07970 [Treponema sp.]|nr:hypothetical protein [Treponema sp.]
MDHHPIFFLSQLWPWVTIILSASPPEYHAGYGQKTGKINQQGVAFIGKTVPAVKPGKVDNQAADSEVDALSFYGRTVIMDQGVGQDRRQDRITEALLDDPLGDMNTWW